MSPTPLDPKQVIALPTEGVDAAAAAIARAFYDNEIWVWTVPSELRRLRTLERYYAATARHCWIPRGTAYVSADLRGAAFWAAPGRWEMSYREQLREAGALLPSAGPKTLLRGMRVDAALRNNHPSEPHWYLNTLTVDPPLQRSGYGSALLEPGLARADADGIGCYLETQREANVPYYARFGFELTDLIEIKGGPKAWLMWRAPQPTAPAD